ncbi:Cyclin-d1-1 [Thalictrum thalictroides]|uniref:Cyclin-d1-1 n=1 Tax=Thalictrum thalictroides TaxID=46969 RepID=A0A7J6W097_THATH|nr:Cyclin-d1-1 [Thalictrum thalictroides]
MSLASCSDWFSDLLCCEDAGILTTELPEEYSSSKTELPDDIEDSINGFIDDERDYMPALDYPEMFRSQSIDVSARTESIAWILKVQEFYRFQPLTAYLSVNYMDRFLSSRCLPNLPKSNGWLLQLISVACLSLAAKMEEPLVPSLIDIQVEGAKVIFEPRTIRRMELLVLNALDWRLRSITPFNFIDFLANKVDSSGTFTRFFISRATEIIFVTTRDIRFLNYCPSSIAAAAIICAANEYPNLCLNNPGIAATWCTGLSKEKIVGCFKLMEEVVVDNCPRTPPKEVPQLRETSSTTSDLSSSSSMSSSSSNKRRKLNSLLWVDDDEDKS